MQPTHNPTMSSHLGAALVSAAEAAARGTVYLLHFERPFKHARHYTGWTTNLLHRLAEHETGRGARLTAVVHAAGIGWRLARIWVGPRSKERALKSQGGASRRCPECLCEARRRRGGGR